MIKVSQKLYVCNLFQKKFHRDKILELLTILRKTYINDISSLKLKNHLDIFLLKVSRKGKREIRKVLKLVLYTRFVLGPLLSRTTDYGRPLKRFFITIPNFGAKADNLGR